MYFIEEEMFRAASSLIVDETTQMQWPWADSDSSSDNNIVQD